MKSEKDKMLAGELYDANYNPGLMQERVACKDLCIQLNNTPFSQPAKQEELVRRIFGKAGKNPKIQSSYHLCGAITDTTSRSGTIFSQTII